MNRLNKRTSKLETKMQMHDEMRPYIVRTADGSVEAHIEPFPHGRVGIFVWFDSLTVDDPDEAIERILPQLPPQHSLFAFPKPLTVEEWTEKYRGKLP